MKRSAVQFDDGNTIEIFGAREHNLKVDHLVLPKNALVVFTGPSGSGKSSLAFDTLYAEGQRRYVESLSAYARQFLGRLDRPQVDKLKGLSPTIAIEQKTASGNPRSTVGTITEINDYLRVLYAKVGKQHCTNCGKLVQGRTLDEIVGDLMRERDGQRVTLVAPIVVHRKGEFADVLADLSKRGFTRVRVDGALTRIDEVPALKKNIKHTIELIVDRIAIAARARSRVSVSVELAIREGKGELSGECEGQETLVFSTLRQCCGISYPAVSPASFSFNGPVGMCKLCQGLGTRLEVDPDLVVPDSALSIRDGAIAPWANAAAKGEGWTYRIITAVSKATGVDLDKAWKKLPEKQRAQVLYGLEGKRVAVEWGSDTSESHGTWGMKFEGVIPQLLRRYHQSQSELARDSYKKYMRDMVCESCNGQRLRAESLGVRLSFLLPANEDKTPSKKRAAAGARNDGTLNIAELSALPVGEVQKRVDALKLTSSEAQIAEGAVREVQSRLRFLHNVGLTYLTLDRKGPTLSGGEAQRIRLASQLGSELSGVLYVLDEPSIGLHARDNERLLGTLMGLRDLGNSVLVVEHDEETIRAADFVVDFGPGAGAHGGNVTFAGTAAEMVTADTLTGHFLSGKRGIEVPKTRRAPKGYLEVVGATEHNLKDITAKIPLGCMAAITGVSGAGKSSLINGILLPALARKLHNSSEPVGAHRALKGLEQIDKVIAINQQPIGRTPRSNPATYTKLFDEIREVYAGLPESKTRGYTASRFSFNVAGGRCEACGGDGVIRVEMHFLSDVHVPCEVCSGRRYNSATLEVLFKGKSIADLLEARVDEAALLFENYPSIARVLHTLQDVGLGYIQIGQQATTLSGGEAQRIKLARELAKRDSGRTLYVLDEPTTGLHVSDVERLLKVLERLVEQGNTVLVIEHNLDVIKCADWIIDLGPEGGDGGGQILAEGTPEQVVAVAHSYTGQYLKEILRGPVSKRSSRKTGEAIVEA